VHRVVHNPIYRTGGVKTKKLCHQIGKIFKRNVFLSLLGRMFWKRRFTAVVASGLGYLSWRDVWKWISSSFLRWLSGPGGVSMPTMGAGEQL
jgi:hypothetical protein